MIIEILKSQLEASNAANIQLNLTVQTLNATISELRATIVNLESLLKERDASLDKAASQLRGMKASFLPKKSEKQNLQAKPQTQEEKDAAEEERKARIKARGNNGAKRKEHFCVETREEDIYPEGFDKDSKSEIGVRDVIRYEMVPLSFIKHIYHIHSFRKDGTVVSGKAPLAPLQNSNFDGSFIAGIAELRYLYSMPVERIVNYFRSNGFDLDKATACGMLAKTANLFENLHKALRKAVKESDYISCDETYHTILVKEKNDNGKGTKKGYIWVIVSSRTGLVYFFYDDGSHSEKVILKELDGYEGRIQSDGLAAYKKLAALSKGKIIRLACLQHCKRAFLDDSLKDNPDAKAITELANSLYENEHLHKVGEGWTAEDNRRWRQEYAPPILKSLKKKLEDVRNNEAKYPPKSDMHKAANYFLNEWDGIEAISHYGDITWDNNIIERTNRYVSISRRNSLFFGSHEGARHGCFYYSLACSCRNLGINFFDYLSDVLNKAATLPPGASIDDYRKLLPDKWTKE